MPPIFVDLNVFLIHLVDVILQVLTLAPTVFPHIMQTVLHLRQDLHR